MPVEVVVPQIGEAISELMIVAWLKEVGDEIKKGDVLFEVDSDKAIVEVEAFVDGTLAEITQPEGSAVLPQDVVAIIHTADDNGDGVIIPPTKSDASKQPTTAPNQPVAVSASPVAQRIADDLQVDLVQVQGTGPGGRITASDVRGFAQQPVSNGQQGTRVLATPKAKRIARERNVDLTKISQGTGVRGMIRVADLASLMEISSAAKTTVLPITQLPDENTQALSKLRQTIAHRTQLSKQTVPHFYLMVDVNMTQLKQLRSYCVNVLQWERPPTFTDVIVRACARSLAEMSDFNTSYSEQGMIQRENVGVGVAVSTDTGLVVPVLSDADQMNLQQISSAIRDVAQRAREGRLKPDDMGSKSLVVSNLGMYEVDAFLAIIDMPDPMILAVGRTSERVVAVDGEAVVQPMCTFTLSVDHRAMDGVDGAKFLERVKGRLENPYEIMG